MARKRLYVCVGINDYPDSGNDLNGCVNDAKNWAHTLAGLGYQGITLLDEEATTDNVLGALRSAVSSLRFGDRLIFQNSSHGSWVPDVSGDEADHRDEVLVMYDWQDHGYITDDQLHDIWTSRRFGSRIVQLSDSCFSGTVARFAGFDRDKAAGERRYFPAKLLTPNVGVPARKLDKPRTEAALLSAATPYEYAYDAMIDGMPQGAFSWAALQTIDPAQSLSTWHRRIRALLPDRDGQWPQHPELHATMWQQTWRLT